MTRYFAVSMMALFSTGVWGQAGPSSARHELDVDKTIDLLLADDELSPGTLELEEGRYRFRVQNGFTPSALTLRIDDDKNVRLKETPGKAHAARVELIENLKPGRYTLWVAQRPKWKVTVTVAAKKK